MLYPFIGDQYNMTNDEIEKIYSIKEKLLVTFKAATTKESKRRISVYLNKIDQIIKDIEEGKSVNSEELNIFSEELRKVKVSKNIPDDDSAINYIARVETLQITDKNKDSEMDHIYSFLIYFEKNFSVPLGINYLKIDYHLTKKRDLLFAHYEAVKHLLKEYIDDVLLLQELRFNEQIEQYKSRLTQQKKYLFIKLSEFLHGLKDFFEEILNDLNKGKQSFFNHEEKYKYKFDVNEKSEFEGFEMETIIQEAYNFTNEFIGILRMPKFKNRSQ